jgi:hypothetical protein
VALENAQHLVSVTAARREPPLFRSAELLQMHIADAVLIKSGSKLAFRKSRPPRCRHGAHIDQESDSRLRQRVEKGVRGGLLVADGEQRFQLSRTLRPVGLLLLGQDCVKHGLFDVRFQRAACRVDERIGAAILQFGVFLLHVVLGSVIAELHVAG